MCALMLLAKNPQTYAWFWRNGMQRSMPDTQEKDNTNMGHKKHTFRKTHGQFANGPCILGVLE
eukprot:11185167-Lingulodinium_polyedra.AAC.1